MNNHRLTPSQKKLYARIMALIVTFLPWILAGLFFSLSLTISAWWLVPTCGILIAQDAVLAWIVRVRQQHQKEVH